MKIDNKRIGDKQACFIIAEAGVNHNGDIKLAKKMVDTAKAAGCDAVKFQTFKAKDLVTDDAKLADYQLKNTKKKIQLDMLKSLELNEEDFYKLRKYCNKKNIIFLSTPHSDDVLDFLNPLIKAYKIASGDLTNLPFLKKIAQKNKPIILSTGMSTLKEVKTAVRTIKKYNNRLVLLHCTTSYPCPLRDVNLKVMLTLKKEFDLPIGYSDHTNDIFVSPIAVALGACVIEKHFTLDKQLEGPDHKASLNPEELSLMVENIRKVEQLMGSEKKRPTGTEKEIMKVARKSIVAGLEIDKGKKISSGMLTVKRPGIGISPNLLNKIIGKKANRNIKKDSLIKFKDLS